MNLSEFKAWLEGYSASFNDGVPTAEQWATVSEKLRNVQPLAFVPYAPRPDDTMTKQWDIRPYYVGDPPPTSAAPQWPCGIPIVTC